jgi:myosin heavy subunit
MLRQLELEGGEATFRYLGNREFKRSGKDKDAFAETKECLARIGLTEAEQMTVFQITAAVLHLGNVAFEEQEVADDSEKHDHGDAAKISEASKHSLLTACKLLGLEPEKVSEAILTKLITVGGKTIQKPQNVALAADKRDALAKMTYSSLFLWLVQRVNQTLSTDLLIKTNAKLRHDDKAGFIGVLDIYGFECFEVNGYEQLLINYCNEKLQRHFNRHLFEVEQDLYASEGVDWTYISFNDNRPCLELIEGGGATVGIINTLDDAWGGMGTTSEKDVKFVSHLHKLFGISAGQSMFNPQNGKESSENGHTHFITPKFGNDRQFVILHYAGEVSQVVEDCIPDSRLCSKLKILFNAHH